MKRLIKLWLQKKLKSWVFDNKSPYYKENRIIQTPTETLKLRSTCRWSKAELRDMNTIQGLGEDQIIEVIKMDLVQDLFKHIKNSGAIEIIQYEERSGISMNDEGIHFEAKLTVVKPKQ